MYKNYNINPRNNYIDDCFPRAYATVMDIKWRDAYKELCKSAMEEGYMIDSAKFVIDFLDKRFTRLRFREETIGEFAENHPIGRYLITTIGHIVACIDGYIIDTWDCTHKKLQYVWKIS